MKIKNVTCLEILDSRGNPTLSVSLELSTGQIVNAQVPSGASKGSMEAFELRDEDPKRYRGMGVLNACKNVHACYEVIKGIDVEKQREIDKALLEFDGTDNKSKIGANAILGLSLAVLKAGAVAREVPLYEHVHSLMVDYFKKDLIYSLPTPIFNLIEGGAHADNGLDFQEFHIIPTSYRNASDVMFEKLITPSAVKDKIRKGSEILHALKKILFDLGYQTGVADEDGYEPRLTNEKDAMSLLCEATRQAGYAINTDIALGIDAAANFFYNKEKNVYVLNSRIKGSNAIIMNYEGLLDTYKFYLKEFPLMYLEDPFSEEDWDSFTKMSSDTTLPKICYCGDDLTVTNPKRLQMAIDKKAVNTIIVKPNQIGSIYETLEVINMCIDNDIIFVLSHRSGETVDNSITDIAVGTGALFLKAGAPQRGERVAKYNRLLEIADELEKK